MIDRNQFSRNNINTLSRGMFMTSNNNHQRENALIFNQILSSKSLRKCKEISVDNVICMWIMKLRGLRYE